MLSYMEIVEQYQKHYLVNGYPFDHEKNPDPNFEKHKWVKIPINYQNKSPSLFPFIIAISEILRFEIGFTQPQYMLSKTHILSQRVEQDDEVGEFRIRTLYSYWKRFLTEERLYWEGMGRVVLIKYIFQDNDFNLYNALVDKNNYFIAIDSDKSFWSVLEKYHICRDIKIQRYNNTPYTVTDFKTPNGQMAYQIMGKKKLYIGDMHAEDYATLPLIKHYHPTDWFFLHPGLKKYSTDLSLDQRFLNEKHFATVKALVTELIKHLLIDLHIPIKQDRKLSHQFIKAQLQKVLKIAKQTEAFKQYLLQNKDKLLGVILYEAKQFLEDKNYQIGDENLKKQVHNIFHDDIIREYNKLLQNFGEDEIAYQVMPLHNIKEFYKKQLMQHHADKIDITIHSAA